MTLCYFA